MEHMHEITSGRTRAHAAVVRIAVLFVFLGLTLSGCSLRSLVLGEDFSSPEDTVLTFSKARDAQAAARCFPDSWPLKERTAFFGRLGEWSAQRIVSSRPTLFAGEPVAVYGKASVVVEPTDVEIIQETTLVQGKRERWWYLLRDCGGRWKILAVYRNSGQ